MAAHYFKHTPAFSLHVACETQAEIDELWEKLLAGGAPSQCGWLTDKFGLSWQIVPTLLTSSWRTRIARNPIASAKPCSAWSSSTSRN